MSCSLAMLMLALLQLIVLRCLRDLGEVTSRAISIELAGLDVDGSGELPDRLQEGVKLGLVCHPWVGFSKVGSCNVALPEGRSVPVGSQRLLL
jgi:hypothetical protein